jgi:hypothetical protein
MVTWGTRRRCCSGPARPSQHRLPAASTRPLRQRAVLPVWKHVIQHFAAGVPFLPLSVGSGTSALGMDMLPARVGGGNCDSDVDAEFHHDYEHRAPRVPRPHARIGW